MRQYTLSISFEQKFFRYKYSIHLKSNEKIGMGTKKKNKNEQN